MSTLRIIEFYNQCHGQDGRFCSSTGAPLTKDAKGVMRDEHGVAHVEYPPHGYLPKSFVAQNVHGQFSPQHRKALRQDELDKIAHKAAAAGVTGTLWEAPTHTGDERAGTYRHTSSEGHYQIKHRYNRAPKDGGPPSESVIVEHRSSLKHNFDELRDENDSGVRGRYKTVEEAKAAVEAHIATQPNRPLPRGVSKAQIDQQYQDYVRRGPDAGILKHSEKHLNAYAPGVRAEIERQRAAGLHTKSPASQFEQHVAGLKTLREVHEPGSDKHRQLTRLIDQYDAIMNRQKRSRSAG